MTEAKKSGRISFVFACGHNHGGIAQLARACGSYPQCHWFESDYRYQNPQLACGFLWLLGQVVKTPPSHGGYRGSNPLGVTRKKHFVRSAFFNEINPLDL